MGLNRVPTPLDEYPVHQAPLPMDRVASSDRNFYDRCYFNAHDRTGDVFLVTGLGVYPNRGVIDAYATARCGGRLRVGDREFAVAADRWAGARDRSWGIRPVGEPEPPGAPDDAMPGFWWLYAPLRFESCALTVILQENPDGYRTVNDARRVWPDGRVEQLGWPRAEISYRAGTRHPESARLHLTDPSGRPLTVELETLTSVPLHVGAGYGGDPDWSHGQWMGREWASSSVYDLADPAVAGRIPFGVTDHLARARLGDETGWGMLEHASIGRHDPSGFADFAAVSG
jgi:hypothetical protein